MADAKQQTHIILVHGAGHGAWCWYKLKPLLEAAGHRVTALDLAASGTDKRTLEELHTFADYSQPLLELMASIPQEEKVVLVGHSLGGMNLAFAMDMFPEKIKVAVFVAAVMPDSIHKPSYVLDQTEKTLKVPFGSPEENLIAVHLGPNYVSSKLYNLCSPEDVALANMLARPCCTFLQDLSNKSPFSKEGFGSVKRVFIVCPEDQTIPRVSSAGKLRTLEWTKSKR
ncbi:UNVERIFIED_CONTAM: Salicylic acid-binding protein 2 [Sesamum calycinum]|uniref:Salicylic acid-binding protein 2 n=1 Tax=Sesamum calycinum TaxID=2727403 RepID=A0AAW2MPP5_9LAMI